MEKEKKFYLPIKNRVENGEVLLSDIVNYYYNCKSFRKTAKYFHTQESSIKALFIKNNIVFYEGKFNSLDNQIARLPVDDIINFYLDTKSKTKTIKQFNITEKVLNKILLNANIEKQKKTIKDLLLEDPNIEQKIINLYLTPESLYFVASTFNIAPQTVKAILTKHNICEHSKEIKEACRQKHRKETCLKIYGVDNIAKSAKAREKYKQTCIEKYGVDNAFKADIIKEKIKQTNLQKYGVENPSQAIEIKEKKEQTCLEHYGVKYGIQSDEVKQRMQETNLNKYGYAWTTQVPEIKNKIAESNLEKYGNVCSLHGPQVIEKVKQTFQEKYGNDCYVRSEDFRNKYRTTMQEKYGVDNISQLQEIKDKKVATMYKNNSFSISTPEEDFYNSLLQLFEEADIVRQYNTHIMEHTNRYPFNCDFYIKSLDLFIELNISWTHGLHPFNKENNNDLITLNSWIEKSKESDYYKNAIEVWTIRDPLKLKTARENNLNYIMIYSKKDIEEFLIKYKNNINK